MPTVRFTLDGRQVEVEDDGGYLLEALRDRLGELSAKDGCSPQGQCGCCTVWVDGAARVACVTPLRRLNGRAVTTLAGLEPDLRDRWLSAFAANGASQCGFCTPGIIMRLAALSGRRESPEESEVRRALAAHLCRCTGWQGIVDAAMLVYSGALEGIARDEAGMLAASRRASIEGRTCQAVSDSVIMGRGGFADDTAPRDSLVAVLDSSSDAPASGRPGRWLVAGSLGEARALSGKVQGRRSTNALGYPVEPPEGEWDLVLVTTFVEPAYLEPDSSWCMPGGQPASPVANGGAFGAKASSPLPEAARELAAIHSKPVRTLWSREDVVRYGPKRPPCAVGMCLDGTGVARVAITPGSEAPEVWVESFAAVLPDVEFQLVEASGPPVSASLRAAGWGEAAVLAAVCDWLRRGEDPGSSPVFEVCSPEGGRASVRIGEDGSVSVRIDAGEVLDETVLRSYAIGAVHQALGWVRSEGISVSVLGEVSDLTVRSFGILPATAMGRVEVVVEESEASPVNASDAVFAATAAAAWWRSGLRPRWPVERGAMR